MTLHDLCMTCMPLGSLCFRILVAIEENRPVTERVAKSSSGSSSLRSGHNLGNVHRAAATDALHEYLQNIFNKG